MENLWLIIITAFSIPSTITGLGLWFVKKAIDKNEKNRAKREDCLIQYQLMLMEGNSVSLTLGEATAKALRDGRTNGEMTKALDEVKEVKSRQSKYLNKQAVEHIF